MLGIGWKVERYIFSPPLSCLVPVKLIYCLQKEEITTAAHTSLLLLANLFEQLIFMALMAHWNGVAWEDEVTFLTACCLSIFQACNHSDCTLVMVHKSSFLAAHLFGGCFQIADLLFIFMMDLGCISGAKKCANLTEKTMGQAAQGIAGLVAVSVTVRVLVCYSVLYLSTARVSHCVAC